MTQNSVLEALDAEDEVSELKLSISGYHSMEKFLVLVEGIDDVKIYEKFFHKAKVAVQHTSGCLKLVELVEKLNKIQLEKYFFGIKDADFDILNHTTYAFPNLFLTDTHDIETMMVNEDVLDSILKEYLKYEEMKKKKEKVNAIELLHEAIQKLKPLSFIRWYNDINKCNLNFSSIKLPVIFEKDDGCGYECCLEFLMKHPDNKQVNIDVECLKEFETSHQGITDDMLLIRGHDLCEMLNILIKEHDSYKKTSNINGNKLETALRLGYDKDHFRETTLYKSIGNWFMGHGYESMFA